MMKMMQTFDIFNTVLEFYLMFQNKPTPDRTLHNFKILNFNWLNIATEASMIYNLTDASMIYNLCSVDNVF